LGHEAILGRDRGGGILGLATARELLARRPGLEVTVLEKERELAGHQTGRNSGVLHTGIYYTPGSLKSRLCTEGRALLKEYRQDRGAPLPGVWQVVIALTPAEQRRLTSIYERARPNGVPGVRLIGSAEITDMEPHAVSPACTSQSEGRDRRLRGHRADLR